MATSSAPFQKFPPSVGGQMSLPLSGKPVAYVANLARISGKKLLAHLYNRKPRCIIDLRVAPTFLLDGMNRGALVTALTAIDSQYYELGGILGTKALADITAIKNYVLDLLAHKEKSGPVFILTENDRQGRLAARALTSVTPTLWLEPPPVQALSQYVECEDGEPRG